MVTELGVLMDTDAVALLCQKHDGTGLEALCAPKDHPDAWNASLRVMVMEINRLAGILFKASSSGWTNVKPAQTL